MKRIAVLTLTAIMMASCNSDPDFATVGKKVDMGSSQPNYSGEYHGYEGKGYVINNKIAVPTIFDEIKFVIERANGETFGSDYMIVEKNGRYGVVKMFQKSYIVPCAYEIVSVIPSKNLIFLKRFGHDMETFILDERREWMGTDTWPPDKFPAEVPLNIITNPEYWRIVSLKCTGRENVPRISSTSYRFEMVIESVKHLELKQWRSGMSQTEYNALIVENNALTNFALHINNNGTTANELKLDRIFTFHSMPVGQTFRFDFYVDDETIRDINFTGFFLTRWY